MNVKSCLQTVHCPLVGWWVGFGCGWVKLNVLQKRWLVCRLAALLILRRVGILSVIFLFVCCRSCRFFRVSANGKGLCEVRATATESGEEDETLAKTFSIF